MTERPSFVCWEPAGSCFGLHGLALGQPNQEDFVEILSRGGEATSKLLRPLVLDLSAMGVRQFAAEVGRARKEARPT